MAEDKKKKSKFSIRKLIYNDKYLIIISILLAVAIWIATSMNLSPETSKTISVPVTVDFSDTAAEQLGLKCFGDETVNVDVTISCKKYLAKDITADNLSVKLQTNAVTTSGYSDVPIQVDPVGGNSNFSIVSYYPTVYRAYFDVEAEKAMDIEVKYNKENFIEDGYMMGEPLLSESTVTIKGPRTYVSQVDKVVTQVDIDGKLKETTSMDLTLSAIDSYGSKVNFISFNTEGESLTITLPVLKEMNLDVTSSFLGRPSKVNMDDFSVVYSLNKVNAGVLEGADIKEANIGSIEFSKLNIGTNKFSFNVNSLDGIVILDNIETIDVTVTVPSSYTSNELDVSSGDVKLINIPQGYNASVSSIDFSKVTVIGTESNLSGITKSNINLAVDLSTLKEEDLNAGTATVTVTTALENSDTCWIYGTYQAVINLTKA